ncbi:hypothetical protein LZF95_07010 [Algoriphagus sp. AGSA1]|uniref:hypothetical protein n=1 Tax=Algoriphagus sp. AGSA1 TaxID=2907213 RepID=UPI001F4361CE|nr:hypothetical protein [Algoriphagus sp. AGSA1]MCE7054415.1 hypothetical protein [Algoriphagus sp. AGSA1]
MDDYLNTFEGDRICESLEECHGGLYHFFCDFANLSYWKRKISAIFEYVVQENPSFTSHSPGTILYAGAEFLRIVYIGYFLYRETNFPACPTPHWDELILKRDKKNATLFINRINLLPRFLSQEQIIDPYLFLKDFYYRRKCPVWARRWNEIIEESFSDITCLEPDALQEFQDDFQDFHKLLEATYLLYVRHFKLKNT